MPTLPDITVTATNWILNKALYGLKQAGRLWYKEINNTLINKLGFNKTYADSNIYYKIINVNEKVIIGLYVDDNDHHRKH